MVSYLLDDISINGNQKKNRSCFLLVALFNQKEKILLSIWEKNFEISGVYVWENY